LAVAVLLEQNDEWTVTKRYLSLETMTVLSDDPNVMPPALAAAWSAVSAADHECTAAFLHHVQDTTVQRVTPNQNCKLGNTIPSPVRRKLKPLSSYAKNPDRRAISQCRQLVRPFGQPTQIHNANAWGR
jgi:hypothetical protein